MPKPNACTPKKRTSKREGSVSRPAMVEARANQGKTQTVSREFLEDMAHGLTQCLQLRGRNAELEDRVAMLEALVERRDAALAVLATLMAGEDTPCSADARDACERRDSKSCAQCWLDCTDKVAVQLLRERRAGGKTA